MNLVDEAISTNDEELFQKIWNSCDDCKKTWELVQQDAKDLNMKAPFFWVIACCHRHIWYMKAQLNPKVIDGYKELLLAQRLMKARLDDEIKRGKEWQTRHHDRAHELDEKMEHRRVWLQSVETKIAYYQTILGYMYDATEPQRSEQAADQAS